MLGVNHLSGFGGKALFYDGSFYSAVLVNNLQNNLKVCLDAGDVNSYDGTSQTFYDRSSADTDFYRGATSSAEADDPTFNGTAGNLSSSEYFTFNDADTELFTLVDASNPTWLENFHKDSAAFTIGTWIYVPSTLNTYSGIFGNAGRLGADGIVFMVYSTIDELRIYVRGNTSSVLVKGTDSAVTTDAWTFLAVSIDEATGTDGGFFYEKGSFLQVDSSNYFDATYTSPSTNSAEYKASVAGPSVHNIQTGFRLGGVLVWDSVLTKAELDTFYNTTKDRYGL